MIWSIQYLRFFACLMVVTLHMTQKSALNDGGGYFSFGASGVDLFFVISGFIMSYISEKKKTGAGDFLLNRFIRIYPIYLATLTPFLIVFLLFPQIVNTHGEVPSILKSITLLPFLDGGRLNMVSWTLSYELYFYIIYSFSLLFIKNATLISTTIILSMILIGKALNFEFIGALISIEFIFGMLIFKLIYRRITFGKKTSILLILIGFSWISSSSNVEIDSGGISRILHYGIPSAIIFIGFLSKELFTKKIKILSLLGDASYSTYLSHILTINAVYLVFKKLGLQNTMYIPMILIGISLSMVVGVIIYKLIEIPLTTKAKSFAFVVKERSSANT